MTEIVCKGCGGPVTREGNYHVCSYCQSRWIIDTMDDIHAVERANAWSALREGDFETAAERFEELIVKDVKGHEGYWGRALALNGILYVDDVRQGKKIPTCNNITENSFLTDPDVKKAISLAPAEIKKSYQDQADLIEKIRVEWLEKARKEPPYDVFISFKDSDRERGIDRTRDSIDAQELYTALVDEGYKVFYSRVSLRGKVSEQYEPYIYNAIKTAKVMIVFGEKPEYFSSAWIKNEWGRFRARIEKGEKHKNSLIVVVKDMSPSDLPVALKSRQAMNMSDLTFFDTLKKHIKRVIDESNQAVRLDKIEIKGGQIAKKAKTLETHAIKTREIGAGATAQTDITEVQTLSLATTYMKAEQWQDARGLVEDVLFNNPACAEALWKQILIEKFAKDNATFIKRANQITDNDLQIVDKILTCATQEQATEILRVLYDCKKHASDETYHRILTAILPYQSKNRAKAIKSAFEWAIDNDAAQTFSLLLSTLGKDDVDAYIDYNYRFGEDTAYIENKEACLRRILSVDEGNVGALRLLVEFNLENGASEEAVIASVENLLKYSKDNRAELESILSWIREHLSTQSHCEIVKQLLRYSTDDISTWKTHLLDLSDKMIDCGFFEQAEYLCRLILTFEALNPTVYWYICLIKLRAKNDLEIPGSDVPIKQIPEYTKFLTLIDETERMEYIRLAAEQEEVFERKRAWGERVRQQEAKAKREQQEREEIARIEKKKKRKKTITLVVIALVILALCLISIVDGCSRGYCKLEDCGNYYVVTGVETGKTEIKIPSKYRGKPVREISDSAFYNNHEIERIEIPDSVTSIGKSAFYNCDKLTSVEIPDGVTSIGGLAFSGCSKLTSVVIGNSVTTIGFDAFSYCSNLTSVVIGDSVTSIGDSAFSGCTNLTFNKYGYANYLPSKTNPYFALISATNKNYSTYTIHQDTKIIADYAFYDCDKLTSIVIPDSVTSIGVGAFYKCDNLTSVEIPDSVTSIGFGAFYWCKNLTSVEIPDSVTSIGEYAFYWCKNLTSVVIGNSVTSIGYEAFDYCNKLTSVYYIGTKSDWSTVSIGSYNEDLTSATRYYYSETQPTTSGNYWHYENGVPTTW